MRAVGRKLHVLLQRATEVRGRRHLGPVIVVVRAAHLGGKFLFRQQAPARRDALVRVAERQEVLAGG